MVGFQRAQVNPQDDSLIDTLVELVEELDATCIRDVDDDLFSFVRLEYLKDQNDTPFAFMALRTTNLFEAYFTAYFNLILQ